MMWIGQDLVNVHAIDKVEVFSDAVVVALRSGERIHYLEGLGSEEEARGAANFLGEKINVAKRRQSGGGR